MDAPSARSPSWPRRARATLLALGAACACASASPAPPAAPLLTQDDLERPELVADWLRKHGGKADRAEAQRWFAEGQRRKARRDWSAAYKAFGESALRYPGAGTLKELAGVALRDLATVRANRAERDRARADLASVLMLYRSTSAAHAVRPDLPDPSLAETRAAIDCLSEFVEHQREPATCPALATYRALSSAPGPRPITR